MNDASVTLAQVVAAAKRGGALIVPEVAGYIALAIGDALARAPRAFDPTDCVLSPDGSILFGRTPAGAQVPSPKELEDGVRRLLGELLRVASGRSGALSRVAVARGTPAGLGALVAELEAALIPVNRAAAHRSLARLAREAARTRDAGSDILEQAEEGGEIDVTEITDRMAFEHGEAGDRESTALPEPRSAMESVVPDDPVTARRANPLDIAASIPSERPGPAPVPPASTNDVDALLDSRVSSMPPPVPDLPKLPPPPRTTPPPPPVAVVPVVPEPAAPSTIRAPPPSLAAETPGPSRVDELLANYAVTGGTAGLGRSDERVARDLRKMAGLETSPLPPLADPPTMPRAPSLPAPALPLPAPAPPPARPSSAAPPSAGLFHAPAAQAAPVRVSLPSMTDLAPRRSRGAMYFLAFLAVAGLGGAGVLWRLGPGFLSGRTPEVVEAETRAAAAAAASAAATRAAGTCRASVIVTDVPPAAEVLVRAGVAPVDIDRLPVGARLEFVALADGFAPHRGVVPAGASWDSAQGKPRFELAIQLDKSRARAGALDPWPPGEPGTSVGGSGPPGTVHIVSTPRGAEVWMTAGLGPEAKIDALPCSAPLELLVATTKDPGASERRRLRVDAAQLTPTAGANVATARISAR